MQYISLEDYSMLSLLFIYMVQTLKGTIYTGMAKQQGTASAPCGLRRGFGPFQKKSCSWAPIHLFLFAMEPYNIKMNLR